MTKNGKREYKLKTSGEEKTFLNLVFFFSRKIKRKERKGDIKKLGK